MNVTVISVPVVRLEDIETSIDKAVREHAQAIVVALGDGPSATARESRERA